MSATFISYFPVDQNCFCKGRWE